MTGLDGLVTKLENSPVMEQGPEVAAPPPEIPVVERPSASGPRSPVPLSPLVFEPPNRVIEWYRFLIWIVPSGVALMTGLGLGWLTHQLDRLGFQHPGVCGVFWFVFNAAATIGTGIFEAKLEHPRWRQTAGQWDPVEVVRFVLAQLFIVPFMALLLVWVLT